MTAIVKSTEIRPPSVAMIGLVLPGLGHLLAGRIIPGLGLLSLTAVLVAAAVLGFPRFQDVVFSGPTQQLGLHGALAAAAWPIYAVALWWTAWRFANPLPQTEEQFNSNQAIFVRGFARNRNGMLGLFGVLLLATIVLFTPFIAPFDPDQVDVAGSLLAPGWHPVSGEPRLLLMGTDQFGRDMFSRVLFGGRISLVIGLIAVSIAATIGVSVGAIAGYAGGWLDRGLMWFVDLLLSLPQLVLLLAIVGLFRVSGVASIFLIVTILGFTGWMSVSRIVRSQVLSLKQQEFVQAARALGMGPARIVFRHLIPNTLAPVIVSCSLAIGGVIIAEASLSFLGLGVPPPTSTWGTLINDGKEPLLHAPWIALFPIGFILTAVMSFNLLGDGLRDALDPKLRGR